MSRVAYVNGRYVPHGQAQVHIEDRGYQFADGVYEVTAIINGELVDEDLHLERLDHSLGNLRIDWPMSRAALRAVTRELIRRNRVTNGTVYLQITRGVAPRDHKFPKGCKPALVMTAKNTPPFDKVALEDVTGADVITVPDIRWKRRDIKSVSLLPNVLGKQAATEAGAYEAWQIDEDGMVTEGTSTNAWIITRDRELITRPANESILNGITRRTLIALAEAEGLTFVERPFSRQEAYDAAEAFLTSTTSFVKPIVRIDDHSIGNGQPGSMTLALLSRYRNYAAAYRAKEPVVRAAE